MYNREGYPVWPSEWLHKTKGEGKLATINQLSVLTDLQKMFVISEFVTAHDAMELLCRPMGLCVGCVSGVAGPNRGEGSARMMKMVGNLLKVMVKRRPVMGSLAVSEVSEGCLTSGFEGSGVDDDCGGS